MAKVAYTNKTDKIQHIGNVTLWPGDTREVDEMLISVPRKAEPEPKPDALLALLDNNVPVIVDAITARDDNGKPTLTDTELVRLKAAEEGGNTRSTLMKAFAEEELRRAGEKADDSKKTDDLDGLIASLPDKSDDELLELSELHQGDESITEAINAEIERRSAEAPS